MTATSVGVYDHLAHVDAVGGRPLLDVDRDLLGGHLVEHDLDRARLEVEDRDARIDGGDRDPDAHGLAVGLDVGEVDGRLEVLRAQATDVERRDVPDLVEVAQVVGDDRARRAC